MAKGWHSDTIIQACIDKFGEEGYRNEGIVNDKQIAKDAKAFMVQQMQDSDKPETYRVEQQVEEV